MRKLLNTDECNGKRVSSVTVDDEYVIAEFDDGSTLMVAIHADHYDGSVDVSPILKVDIEQSSDEMLCDLFVYGLITREERDAERSRRCRAADQAYKQQKAARYHEFVKLVNEFDPEAAPKYPTSYNCG